MSEPKLSQFEVSENRCTIKCNGHFDLILNAEKLGMDNSAHCDVILISGNKVYLIELKAWKADLESNVVNSLFENVNNKFYDTGSKIKEVLKELKSHIKLLKSNYTYIGYLVAPPESAVWKIKKEKAASMRARRAESIKIEPIKSGDEMHI